MAASLNCFFFFSTGKSEFKDIFSDSSLSPNAPDNVVLDLVLSPSLISSRLEYYSTSSSTILYAFSSVLAAMHYESAIKFGEKKLP